MTISIYATVSPAQVAEAVSGDPEEFALTLVQMAHAWKRLSEDERLEFADILEAETGVEAKVRDRLREFLNAALAALGDGAAA